MISILGLEITSVLSLIFGILNIFFKFTSVSNMFLLYLWFILISIPSAILFTRKKIFIVLLGLGFLPLIYFEGETAFSFLLLSILIIGVYIIYGFNKGSYDELVSRFKVFFWTLGLISLSSLLSSSLREIIVDSIQFFIIYVLTTSILIRSIRHLQSGMDPSKLVKINTSYMIIISIFSLIIGLDRIRGSIFTFLRLSIFSIIQKFYLWLVNILITIIYYPVTFIYRLFNYLFRARIEGNMEDFELNPNLDNAGDMDFANQVTDLPEILETIIVILGNILIILLIIYIVYRILSNLSNRSYSTIEYSEQREFIKSNKKKKRLAREKYPSQIRDQIRYYYRRYLEKLEKSNIEISKADTSLDINNKSKEEFTNTDIIRDIYKQARYKEDQPAEEQVGKIKNAYKNM